MVLAAAQWPGRAKEFPAVSACPSNFSDKVDETNIQLIHYLIGRQMGTDTVRCGLFVSGSICMVYGHAPWRVQLELEQTQGRLKQKTTYRAEVWA